MLTIALLLSQTVGYARLDLGFLENIGNAAGSSGANAVERQFRVWFAISICYIFEALYRPCNLKMASHHVLLQAGNYYYWFYANQGSVHGPQSPTSSQL